MMQSVWQFEPRYGFDFDGTFFSNSKKEQLTFFIIMAAADFVREKGKFDDAYSLAM